MVNTYKSKSKKCSSKNSRFDVVADKLITCLIYVSIIVELFVVCTYIADTQRGYEGAIGGEFLIFLLPVIIGLIKRTIKDFLNNQ